MADHSEANKVSGLIVDSALKVHTVLGPGLLESAYEAALAYELRRRELQVATQVALPVVYEGMHLEIGYRLDLVVNDCIVVEVKAVEAIHDLHRAQLLSYLKLSKYRIGLLLNFHVQHMKQGIVRLIL